MTLKLDEMSRKELTKLAIEVQSALNNKEVTDRRDALEAAIKAAAQYGYSLSEILPGAGRPASAAKLKRPPKYANPKDKSQTWSGSGRQPFWFKSALQEGVDPSKMEIKNSDLGHLSDLLVRLKNEGIHFCSLSEGINTTTPGGKLVYHLFSAFAEFQRDIIIENTKAGLDAARKRGKRLGRPPAIDIDTLVMAHQAIQQDGISVAEAARRCGVPRTTLMRG